MTTTKFSRRALLAGAAAVTGSGLLLPRFSRAAEFNLKLGSEMPVSHPCIVRAQEACLRIREETSGRVDVQVFPNNQLGAAPDMLGQLRSGAMEFYMASTNLLQSLAPHCALLGVGFAFKDNQHAITAMDGELGAYIRKQIEATGLVVMPKIWTSGFRHVSTNIIPIHTPADLKGLKIRVPPAPLLISLFTGLDASPTAINYAELYMSLQTKVVDAQDGSLVNLEASRMYEVQKFCSMTKHGWDGFSLLANRRSFGRLSAQLQGVVAKHFDRSAMDERADMDKLEVTLRDTLTAKGMKFNDVKKELFVEKMRSVGYYTTWKEKFGPDAWKVLEKYTGTLA